MTATLTIGGQAHVFTFRPVNIKVGDGTISVRVSCVASLVSPNGIFRGYMLRAERRAVFTPTAGGQQGALPVDRGGNAMASGQIPEPAAITAFVMPPLEWTSGGPDVPDRFSIRMRIRPAQ